MQKEGVEYHFSTFFFFIVCREVFLADCIICFLSVMLFVSDAGYVRYLSVTGLVFHTAS